MIVPIFSVDSGATYDIGVATTREAIHARGLQKGLWLPLIYRNSVVHSANDKNIINYGI